MELARILDIEPVLIETNLTSAMRLISKTENKDSSPTIVVDCGAKTIDISILDTAARVTGTIPYGGDTFTTDIAASMKISEKDAHALKTRYGMSASKYQKNIQVALEPTLSVLIKEIHKLMRYYEERNPSSDKIQQVVTMGGGANLPGLSEYLTGKLRIPARLCSPWFTIPFKKIQHPHEAEGSMYITVAGLAQIKPKEIFKP